MYKLLLCRAVPTAVAVLTSFSISAAAATATKHAGEVVYLDCTGTRPVWSRSWADQPAGMTSDKAKLVIRLDPSGKTATVEGLFDGDEFVFDIQSKPEWYYGAGTRSVALLDGQIVQSNISLNRIHGGAYIGFEVAASPKNGSKVAFSGTCERSAVKY